MTRNKDIESHQHFATEQELKVAEKAREHQVEIEAETVELRKPGGDCQEFASRAASQSGGCAEWCDTETT